MTGPGLCLPGPGLLCLQLLPLLAGSVTLLLLAACIMILQVKAGTCNANGDDLSGRGQWQAAVQAYRDCSHSHGNMGPEAAWSQYRIFHVHYWHLKDKKAAAAACRAGWEAYHAPELAWCMAFTLSYMQQNEEAKLWAQQAISVGCFQGSCKTLSKALPDPSSDFTVDACAWEGPFDVLHWACKGLGDEACAEEASRREYQAKYARVAWSSRMDDYEATKVGPQGLCRVAGGECWVAEFRMAGWLICWVLGVSVLGG